MPVVIRYGDIDGLTPVKRSILFDNELPTDGSKYAFEMDAGPGVDPYQELWDKHRDSVLDVWIRERPGTRPSLWWRYSAPRWTPPKKFRRCWFVPELSEPRLRLGGKGEPSFETTATVPCWPLGIPTPWETLDATDPPIFESQAAYLKRNGLLFDGEEARADFEPEVVTEEPEGLHEFCKKHGIR